LIGRLPAEISARLDGARIASAAELIGTLRLPEPEVHGSAASARAADEAAIAAGGAPS
jgi:hypothetical protein